MSARVSRERPSIGFAALAIVAVLGWVWLLWVAILLAAAPAEPRTGFDLQLLTQAGRDVAAGRSPYAASLLGGTAPVAESLFYSYPPVVAQAMAFLAPLPDTAVLVLWDATALVGLGAVAAALARRLAPHRSPRAVVAGILALAPLCFPFAIGLLFGNFDVFFPLLYGAMLLAVLPRASAIATRTGGIALAIGALAKLHPASLGLWFAARSLVGDGRARSTFLTALAVGLAAIAVSAAIGGIHLWTDYVAVVRAGANADLIDPDNAGFAAQLALLLGRDDVFARTAQIVVTTIVVLVTILAARRGGDPVERFAWAAAASLTTLPVTWYHYPSALIPFGLAALLRADATPLRRDVWILIGAALVVAAAGIIVTPLIWVAIGLLLAAVRRSRPGLRDMTFGPSGRSEPT